jgi:DDE superfamily endonuclease
LAYCPRSSLPVPVLAWLADRLAYLLPPRPSGRGDNPPLPLEVRLDAVAAVVLDGLSYRRAGRTVGISKTEVGDSMDLLLPELAGLGYCQSDRTFITTLAELRQWLGEMAASGEAVCVDGLATRVQRPKGWASQKVLYDPKRHAHTAQGVAVSTIHGDLLWCDGGWPGSCHEQELLALSGLDQMLDAAEVAGLVDRGFRGWPSRVSTGMRRSATAGQGPAQRRPAGVQPLAGGAARAGGAGDRPSRQRPGAVPLAGPAVPAAGRLPSRWRTGLPGPLAAPGSHMNQCRSLGADPGRPL